MWWPTFNQDVEELIKHCHSCQVNTPPKSHSQPLQLPETPQRNWEKLAVDFKRPLPSGESILIDYKSRYAIAISLKLTATDTIIKQMEQVFTMFGYLDTLISDNDQQFTSNDFEFYLQTHNIKHQLISPYWTQTDGEVERFNRTIIKAIKCTLTENKDSKEALQQFLLMYRTTPHTTTGISPAQMLFQHIPNNGLPTIQRSKSTVNNRETNYREQSKERIDKKRFTKHKDFQIGDEVLVKRLRTKSKIDSFYEQHPYTITENYKNSVRIKDTKGKVHIRNKAHVKQYFQKPVNISSTTQGIIETDHNDMGNGFITLFID